MMQPEDTLQAYIDAFARSTQYEWQMQDAAEYHVGGEDYIFIFLGAIVLFIFVCWLAERHKRKRSAAALAVVIALALASCNTTYHATTEQPFVAGHSLGVNPSEATIKVGRKTAVISQGDVKTVPRDSVTVDGKRMTVGFTERIKVVYEL